MTFLSDIGDGSSVEVNRLTDMNVNGYAFRGDLMFASDDSGRAQLTSAAADGELDGDLTLDIPNAEFEVGAHVTVTGKTVIHDIAGSTFTNNGELQEVEINDNNGMRIINHSTIADVTIQSESGIILEGSYSNVSIPSDLDGAVLTLSDASVIESLHTDSDITINGEGLIETVADDSTGAVEGAPAEKASAIRAVNQAEAEEIGEKINDLADLVGDSTILDAAAFQASNAEEYVHSLNNTPAETAEDVQQVMDSVNDQVQEIGEAVNAVNDADAGGLKEAVQNLASLVSEETLNPQDFTDEYTQSYVDALEEEPAGDPSDVQEIIGSVNEVNSLVEDVNAAETSAALQTAVTDLADLSEAVDASAFNAAHAEAYIDHFSSEQADNPEDVQSGIEQVNADRSEVEDALQAVNDAEDADSFGAALTDSALGLSLTAYNNLSERRQDTVNETLFNSGDAYGDVSALQSAMDGAVQTQEDFSSIQVNGLSWTEQGNGYLEFDRIAGGASHWTGADHYELYYIEANADYDELTMDTEGASSATVDYLNQDSVTPDNVESGVIYEAVIYATDGTNYSTASNSIIFSPE
ncbi:hypothetical protein [Salibacterium aidingense]|uniref:hypothetical protein n=1 Tax=Salibacterium aidingense TaxID=384933 RepID=UPI0004142B0B|nr:hypothetical protein [Salibacterium aidingense]